MPSHPHRDRLLDTEAAAQAAQVPTYLIRTWRTRGWKGHDGQRRRLPVAAHDRKGLPLHRFEDVLNAERETRRSGKSYRRNGPPQPDWETLNLQGAL